MNQQQKVACALCAIGGLVIGFFAGVQYVQWRMVSAFAGAAQAISQGFGGESGARVGTSAKGASATVQADKFEGISLSNARIGASLPGVGASLDVTVTNGGSRVLSRVEFDCEVKSADRSVPWATCSGMGAQIAGGLEPGESRAVEARGFGGMYGVERAIAEHPDATLTVTLSDAFYAK